MSMSELQIGAEMPAIVGEIEAGRSAKVRREINKLVKGVSANTFDLAELLFETKSKNFYKDWGFDSFGKYAKSLEIKYSKCYYLVKIIRNMQAADLKREEYEPVGLTKLRTISRLDPEGEFNGVPMPMVIRTLTQKAATMTPEEVTIEVDTILGLVEDDSMVWLNVKIKKSARDNVIIPAMALAKKHSPESQTQDEDGNYHDMSDGAALEMIAANFLADPNYNSEDEVEPATKEDKIPATE
jgi:hypothetical protein